MIPAGRGFQRLDRLDVRLVILLGIALLPIGLIAVTQTIRMMSEVEARTSAALMGETQDAAKTERELILTALGASRAMASVGPGLLKGEADCSVPFIDLQKRLEAVTFAGIILRDGTVACANDGVGRDVSDRSTFRAFFENPTESIELILQPAISDGNVILVRQPLAVDGTLAGYIAISTSLAAFSADQQSFGDFVPIDIVTFSNEGEILTTQSNLANAQRRLPTNRALKALAGSQTIFRDSDATGADHVYTVAPLLRGSVFVMAIWGEEVLGVNNWTLASAIAFPMVMWIASLAVAYFAVHALVIRHIRSLRRRIRIFSSTRRLVADNRLEDMPVELREVTEAFQSLTERILRDEADLENNLHEKDVLLKEVHHRVKNNLQLIASMTNMQMRQTTDPQTRSILRRLQDRILGMAAVHRSLYETTSLSEVRADRILREVATQLMRNMTPAGSAISLDLQTEPVNLYPDQALPLSLLLTEALTNALKHTGKPPDGPPVIRIDLTVDATDMVELSIENTLGEELAGIEDMESSGLGTQLMAAFTMQLGAASTTEHSDHIHRLVVRFARSEFTALPVGPETQEPGTPKARAAG